MVDISEKGFKMISEERISIGSELAFTVHLPDDLKGWKELSFKAWACWCSKDVNPNYYISGYRIDEIEPDGETVIALIIRHYGYNV